MSGVGSNKISAWVWLALAALILLALAVIFVLPRVVQEYELPLVKRAAPAPVVATTTAVSSPSAPAISPFEEAQRARQRREAQDVLASLLRRQAELDEASVALWSPDEYSAALDAARRGDESYRSGEFSQAMVAYQESDLALSALQDELPLLFERLLAEGEEALQSADSQRALTRFELAVQIDPPSADAQEGLRRAKALDEVEELLREGERLQAQGDVRGAGELFRQAVALDSDHLRAVSRVADNRQRVIDADFTSIMSAGFAQLQQGDAQAAISAFERALRVKPGNQQATEAIVQTREQITLETIAAHRRIAEGHEEREQWELAVASYDQALALDPNVIFAVEGRDYSARRLQLDNLLQLNIQQPERLADQAAFDEALEVLRIARDLDRDLSGAGPRLTSQLASMESLLDEMQIPLEVTIISDNVTIVTIYQVGQLGNFTETSLLLRPGRYVAVGTRPGYRDVREEFVVGFGHELNAVTIRCNEQIAAVNRR